MTRTIHLIYSVPQSSNLIMKAINKVINVTGIFQPLYRNANDLFIPWRKPIRAPHSISYNLLHEFKKYGKVKYYSLYERGTIQLGDEDILIGVPAQNHSKIPWEKPDNESILIRTLEKYPNHKQSYIIMPYSNDPLFVGWANDIIKKHGKKLLLLSAKYWFDHWNESPWKDFAIEKKVRVEMAIDPLDYPFIKNKYNPIGERGFLYIGHTSWYKNTKQLEKIAASMPGTRFGHIGQGTISGWNKISDFADLNRDFMLKISESYDCFVNVSWDAQVTTVLEQMCFGMPVACTPQSGYEYKSIIPMSIEDTSWNVKQLTMIQNMNESELKEKAFTNREIAIQKHNWKQFVETVTSFINIA